MKKLFFFAALAMLILTGCSKKQGIYDFSVKDIDGKDIFDKIDVNGENESPLYTYLKAARSSATYSHRFISRQAPASKTATPSNGTSGNSWSHATERPSSASSRW